MSRRIKDIRHNFEEMADYVKKPSLWTKTRAFKRLTRWAFKVCDQNGSGHINKTELYAGMLLVHLNLAKYAGPAACYPPTREVVNRLFDATDDDKSGGIDEVEFEQIMIIMCSQITSRIAVYYAILILLVPYLIVWSLGLMDLIGVDYTLSVLDHKVWDRYAPSFLRWLVGLIPDSAWESLPESLVGVALFYLVIPFCWDRVDSLAQGMGEKVDTSAESLTKEGKEE